MPCNLSELSVRLQSVLPLLPVSPSRLLPFRYPSAIMKSLHSAALALALAGTTHAGLRFGCSSLTIQRLDPVVEPGNIPSSHLHHIAGGNAFNATMTGDVGARGTCTTCQMSQDFSNYWTAVMYFKHPTNGSYHRIPVINNAALAQGTTGGITIYYTPYDLLRDNIKQQPITAFKPVRALAFPLLTWRSNPCRASA